MSVTKTIVNPNPEAVRAIKKALSDKETRHKMLRIDLINCDAYVDVTCECSIRSGKKITEMRAEMSSFIKRLRDELKETNSAILPAGVRAEELKAIRDYFAKNDKTTFEHRAYDVMDKILKNLEK